MRVLVCGGRDYDDIAMICAALDGVNEWARISIIIHGAARGADQLAKSWAQSRNIPDEPYPVTRTDWQTKGRAAGPLRNQQMLDKGKPDIVVAFPGGPGTADMVRRAKAVGLTIVNASPSSTQGGG